MKQIVKQNRIFLQISFSISIILYLFLQTNLIFSSFASNVERYLLVLKNVALTLSIILIGYFSLEFKWSKRLAPWLLWFVIVVLEILGLIMVALNFMGLYGHWVNLPESYLAPLDFLSYITYKTGIIYVTLFFTITYLVRIILFKKADLRNTRVVQWLLLTIIIIFFVLTSALIITVIVYDYYDISYSGIYKRMNFFYGLEEPTVGSVIFMINAYFIGLGYNYFQVNKFLVKKFKKSTFIFQWLLLISSILIYFTSQWVKKSHSTITFTTLFISFFLFVIISTLKPNFYSKKINNIFNTTLIMSGIGTILVYIINFTLDFRSTFFVSFIKTIYGSWWFLTIWTFVYLLIVYFICYLIKKIIYYLFVRISMNISDDKEK